MRRNLLHTVLLVCLIVWLSGCSNDGSKYPSVQLAFVTALTSGDGHISMFTTDEGRSYLVSDDRSSATYDPGTTKRIVANYELQSEGTDTTAVIYASLEAISSLPKEEVYFTDGIHTDGADLLSGWLGGDYLNIVLNVLSQDKKHSFAFIQKDITESNGRRHVSLLLYHNSNDDMQAYTKRAYLSVPLPQYAGTDKKGAVIDFSLYTTDGTLKTYSYDYVPK